MMHTPLPEAEKGDYVSYMREYHDGIGIGRESGSGYLVRDEDHYWIVANGDRLVEVSKHRGAVTLRCKQYRLEV